MSERKTRREIDKAVRHLIEYEGPNNEWEFRMDELEDEFLAPVADELDLSMDEVSDFFLDGPFEHMAFGFLFEEYATAQWDNDDHSLIEAYLKHRGWREGSAGRRYLQALATSELKFWEIAAVKPGAYADIREYGSKDKPIRVKEKAATESLHQWDGLAARVLPAGNGYMFSGDAAFPARVSATRPVGDGHGELRVATHSVYVMGRGYVCSSEQGTTGAPEYG